MRQITGNAGIKMEGLHQFHRHDVASRPRLDRKFAGGGALDRSAD
jgi:hypothetical protein